MKIFLDDPDQSKFPIGAQGTAAIYTSSEHGAWAALRKISIRAQSWLAGAETPWARLRTTPVAAGLLEFGDLKRLSILASFCQNRSEYYY